MAILWNDSPTARRREWNEQARLRIFFARMLERDVARELRRVHLDAALAVERGNLIALRSALAGHRDRLGVILTRAYRRVMSVFGERVFERAEAVLVVSPQGEVRRVFGEGVRRWIAGLGRRNAERIASGTQRRVHEIIGEAEADGLDSAEIARRLRTFQTFVLAQSREQVVARTEIHTASQAAVLEALKALRLPAVRRRWVAAMDRRTRNSHRRANGQSRAIHDPFIVGGVRLRYPGDPLAPPREVINCRCIAIAALIRPPRPKRRPGAR
ncbi:MAG: phage head morphogenesis protein [Kiloniellales bacterium]|nr:phage head morphogenesis protein [Kiloniellales bacterium]